MSSVSGTINRLTGMASGLDTESIVENLMAASRLKLQMVEKQKTSLQWKQEAYQEMIQKLGAFQTKYFGTASASSTSTLFGNSLLALNASYSSSYVSVAAGTNVSAGSIYIGDIMSLASSAKLTGTQGASADPTIDVDTSNLGELAGKSIMVTLNGVQKPVTFSDKTYASVEDVRSELANQLSSAFGDGKISVWYSGSSISLSSSNSTLQLRVPSTAENDPSSVLDFGGYASNRFSLTDALGNAGLKADVLNSSGDVSFAINGTEFSFDASATMNDIIKAVNNSDAGVRMTYSALSDTFSLAATETGKESSVAVEDTAGSLMATLFGGASYTAGTDAVVKMSMNGSTNEADLITVTRSSNTLTVDGTTITLKGMAADDAQEGIDITLSYDTEDIATQIEAFVKEYNELLSTLTDKLAEDRYADYEPLTDDEKAELSESEIKLWTEKAKSGFLRNDSYLSAIVTELRSSMSTLVGSLSDGESAGILAEIGITTGNYSEKGQLHVNATKLREALESDTGKVLDIFTQNSGVSYSAYASAEQRAQRFEESGVLWRLSDVLSKNLSTVGKKGALIALVGSPNSTYKTDTEYAKRISAMETKISDMQDKMKSEEDRYWARFTAMETALSKMQSQSNWLTSMLGKSN